MAQPIVAKGADRVPSRLQTQIYTRPRARLDRSTLFHWSGRAAWLLGDVETQLLERLKASEEFFAAKRPRPCALPGPRSPASYGPTRLRRRHGAGLSHQAWSPSSHPTARPDGRSPSSPASSVCWRWTASRATAPAAAGDTRLVSCGRHVRRRITELAAAGRALTTSEALAHGSELYDDEREVCGRRPGNTASLVKRELDPPPKPWSPCCAPTSKRSCVPITPNAFEAMSVGGALTAHLQASTYDLKSDGCSIHQ